MALDLFRRIAVMDQRVFVHLLLFTGILPLVRSVDHKYYLIQQSKSWNDAQDYCHAKYTDLATITTSNDLLNIQNVAVTKGLSSSAWIGLYTDARMWLWSLQNEPMGDFISWNNGNPNNLQGNEQCGYIYFGKWNDAKCDLQIRSVCFDGRDNATNRYIYVTQRMTWYDAQRYCRQMYTDLASARNATENSIIGGKDYWNWIWFGLYKEPWKFSDQTSNVSIIKWAAGDVNDYLQNKSCGVLYAGLASQAQCSSVMPFFCYGLKAQMKIIRLKVKSSVDVNDPVILEAIYEKINQTLMSHGMTEKIAVKWREQSDGVVFHREKGNITTAVRNG